MRRTSTILLTFVGALISAFTYAAAPALREQISLNGTWTQGGNVPHYASQDIAFDFRTYERQVTVPSTWTGKVLKLEFGAVNWYCDVFINGTKIGSHFGAWVPFEMDITNRVSAGQTFTLRLDVRGMLQSPTYVDNKVLSWIGFNDLNKYRAGIVDDVWLRAYGKVHIQDAFVQTSYRNKTIKIDYTLKNQTGSSWTGRVTGDIIRESTRLVEKTVQTADVTLAPGEVKTVSVSSSWTTAAAWWPDQPNLYHLKSSLAGGNHTDVETRRFGFREFWIEGTQFRLNDIALNLRGDWCCYSQYWGRIPDAATLKRHYEGVLRTNSNVLRWHKHPAPRFAYDMADEMGLMIINESAVYSRPYMNHDQKVQFVDNCVALTPAWIKAARNHASVVIWSASNEVTWGSHANFPPAEVKRLGDAIYALDQTRPVNYDGDPSVPGVMVNYHYPEWYEHNPTSRFPNADMYNDWKPWFNPDRPVYFGEILAVRPGINDNGWWIGVWPRGLRHMGFAGIAPRVYYPDSRITAAQAQLHANGYNPIAMFDMAYDKLGIKPFKDNILPAFNEGSQQTRRVVVFNDDYRNTSVTAEIELRVDGVSYAKGSRAYTIPIGSRVEFDYQFQAPHQGGRVLDVVLRTYKNNVKRFEEAKRFNLTDVGTSGTSSNVVTLGAGVYNQAPNVNLTAPANGASYNAPATVSLAATATDGDGFVTKVEFYANGILVGTDTTSPYSFSWTNVRAGTYSVTARAIDNLGAARTSAAISITVNGTNAAPSVALTSPANGASFTAPASVTLAANASDSDGTIAKVEFFANGTLLNTDTAAPYSFAWGNVAAGSYSITARATDNAGATTASTAVSITVAAAPNAAPSVALTSPANGASFTAPASVGLAANASDSDGTIAKVEFFANGTLLNTDTTAPYSFAWGNVAAGSYSLTARATDNAGATTTSTAVSITVAAAPNAAPTVSLTAPVNGASFTAPATITISANASDSDGSIARVEFFNGSTKLGEDTTAPYSFIWSDVVAGSYTLTARATDNAGAQQTSSAVTITVSVLSQAVVSLTLINADTDQDMFTLTSGTTLNLATLPTRNLNVRANTNPAIVGSVRFGYDGNANYRTESGAPYAFASDNAGNYFNWTPTLGAHTITATPFTGGGGGGTPGTALVVSFTVIDQIADTTKPVCTIQQPTSNATYDTTSATLSLSGTASDNVGVTQVSYTLTGATSAAGNASGTTNWSLPTLTLNAGTTTITVTARDAAGNSASDSLQVVYTPPSVTFTLVNADTNLDIGPLTDGSVINFSTLPTTRLNVRADTTPSRVGSLRFGYDGNSNYRTENGWPYALASDNNGDYFAWTPTAGTHTLSGTPFSGSSGTGTAGTTVKITFSVVSGTTAKASPSLAASGSSNDSDGDGLLDRYERVHGLDPYNADSNGDGVGDNEEYLGDGSLHAEFQVQWLVAHPEEPAGGNEGAPTEPLSVTGFSAGLKFGASADRVSVSGLLPGTIGAVPEGTVVTLNIGGATASFTLDSKGRARTGAGSLQLKRSKGTNAISFGAKLTVDLDAALADEGISATADVKNGSVALGIRVEVGAQAYVGHVDSIYSAKAGKTARVKAKK
ncbi:MAG TPA: Ig-like domain-containing protein [Planctomycetota bacterium]|nr:Ig-like domain-containing protein [Planctomycetota bacterium]